MKSILKVTVLSALFILTSCGHFGSHGCKKSCSNCKTDTHKCEKHEQCPMKAEHKDAEAKAETPVKK